MTYHSSMRTLTQTTSTDRAIASVLVAGVTFILGYTVVRASLAQAEQASTTTTNSDPIQMAVPSEGTLWQDFGTSF